MGWAPTPWGPPTRSGGSPSASAQHFPHCSSPNVQGTKPAAKDRDPRGAPHPRGQAPRRPARAHLRLETCAPFCVSHFSLKKKCWAATADGSGGRGTRSGGQGRPDLHGAGGLAALAGEQVSARGPPPRDWDSAGREPGKPAPTPPRSADRTPGSFVPQPDGAEGRAGVAPRTHLPFQLHRSLEYCAPAQPSSTARNSRGSNGGDAPGAGGSGHGCPARPPATRAAPRMLRRGRPLARVRATRQTLDPARPAGGLRV